ncbi:MAG: DMT family transporter [Anaerolineaceae bacterium]
MGNSSPKFKNIALLVVGVLSVSTGAILIRLAMNEARPLVIAAYRLIFSAIISIMMVLITRPKLPIKLTRSLIGWMSLSGFFLAMHFASWISSLELTNVSSSVVVVSTTPLWVALLSPILLKEKVRPRFYVGMLLALLGGAIIAINERCTLSVSGLQCGVDYGMQESSSLLGLFLALVGAFMAAGYMLIGRKLSGKIDTVRYTAVIYSIAAAFLLFIVVLRGDQLSGFSGRVWGLFLVMAIVPQILGHSVLNYSLQALPATTVSIALLGEPVGATILAMIFLKELPSTLQLIGGIMIMIGIVYSVFPAKASVNAV